MPEKEIHPVQFFKDGSQIPKGKYQDFRPVQEKLDEQPEDDDQGEAQAANQPRRRRL